MRLTITQDDINRGRCGSQEHCPIAHALRARVPGANVKVRACFATVIGPNERPSFRRYALSGAARAFILAFDQGKPVEPCTVELRSTRPK